MRRAAAGRERASFVRRTSGAALGFLLLSGSLAAQTRPMPSLPAGPSAPAWEYGLGVGALWDSNFNFVPEGPSSWAVAPRGNLAHSFRGPKGELRLEGSGVGTLYGTDDIRRYDAALAANGSYRSSAHTTWSGNLSYGLGYSDSSPVLNEQGVVLPVVGTTTLAGELAVARRLGPRTSLRLGGRMYRTEFDEEDAGPLGLVDGQSLRGTASLERSLGTRDSAAVEYSIENARGRLPPGVVDGQSSYVTHFGSLQWTHLLTERSGLLVEAGASYTPDAIEAGLGGTTSFYGGASYRWRVGRSNVSVFARREVSPAFGIGVIRVDNRVGLDLTAPIGRSWRLSAVAAHTRPDSPDGAVFTYGTTDEATATVGRRLGRRFELSAEGSYRRRGAASATPPVEAYRGGLFLSFVSP